MNKGKITDYYVNPKTERFEFAVVFDIFDGSKEMVLTINEEALIAAGIKCADGVKLEALIDETATEEIFAQPTFLRPLTETDAINS